VSELSPVARHLVSMYASINGTELYVDVDGTQLRVDQAGTTAGTTAWITTRPTIVVLHGGPGFDQGYLRPGIGHLRDLAQLIFVDLRGQGRSGKVAVETCTLEQMADDVVALRDRLGLDRPILLGHSAGGFVALHAALRAPDTFGGLILCNTAATLAAEPDPGAPTLEERAGTEAAQVAARLFGGDVSPETGAAFARLVAPYYAGPAHMDVPGQLFPLSLPSLDVMRYFFDEQAAHYDVRPRLHEITAPTLVIAGGYDWVCPPAAAHAIAAGIPGAALVIIEDAGHFLFSEEPARFRAAVAAYLRDRIDTPAGSTARPAWG
jgi:proline iminopeptidase